MATVMGWSDTFGRQGEISAAMHVAKCPMELARLCMNSVRIMYCRVTLHLGDSKRLAPEFLYQALGLFVQVQNGLVARAELDKAVAELASR